MAKRKQGDKIGSYLRKLLAEKGEVKHQPAGLNGPATLTNAELLARKLLDRALSSTDQWAVQTIIERAEGKAVAAERIIEQDTSTEEKLSDVTRQHLNALTKQITSEAIPADDQSRPVEQADSAARADVPMPKNGDSDTKVARPEPTVAANPERSGRERLRPSGPTVDSLLAELRSVDKRIRMDIQAEDGGG